MNVRQEVEARECRELAAYAVHSVKSRGRDCPIEPDTIRTVFQRDRDRIIHCKAFRRLEYKTQVFVNHEGDHYRTRLTHSLEVWQIGQTIASALGLNLDLAGAIALGHDLGHTPFGHSGEDALNSLLPEGFRHYEQGIRVVEELEDSYPDQPGLNLTFEVREGILKHVIWKIMLDPDSFSHLEPTVMPSLEAQVINMADPIAFISHDLDDGLRAGILDQADLRRLRIAKRLSLAGEQAWLRHVIPLLVTDVVSATAERLVQFSINSPDDVREHAELLVDFSPEIKQEKEELSNYLFENFYDDYRVRRMRKQGIRIIEELYRAFISDWRLLPTAVTAPKRDDLVGAEGKDQEALLRPIVRDYIAGMTDRFAFKTYAQVIGGIPLPD
ncbi:MAG TPA: deoxyguanosinetriphosphate triphosphohydrolase [Candidatus Acetothermia bacterium]|nr:deoxyguanosinetriphosphate triphosphohydrolase [Candidatus Acetothermia bacterium]